MRVVSVRAGIGLAVALATVAGPGANAGLLPHAQEQKATVLYVLPQGASDSRGDTLYGGCLFVAVKQLTLTGGLWSPWIGSVSVATDSSHNLIPATVSCQLISEVVAPPHVYSSARGVPVGLDQAELEASDTDAVELCQTVTFGVTTAPTTCEWATEGTVPQQAAFDSISALSSAQDPQVCPLLSELGVLTGGGVTGVLEIQPDGDVSVDDAGTGQNPVYDCPPFDK